MASGERTHSKSGPKLPPGCNVFTSRQNRAEAIFLPQYTAVLKSKVDAIAHSEKMILVYEERLRSLRNVIVQKEEADVETQRSLALSLTEHHQPKSQRVLQSTIDMFERCILIELNDAETKIDSLKRFAKTADFDAAREKLVGVFSRLHSL